MREQPTAEEQEPNTVHHKLCVCERKCVYMSVLGFWTVEETLQVNVFVIYRTVGAVIYDWYETFYKCSGCRLRLVFSIEFLLLFVHLVCV